MSRRCHEVTQVNFLLVLCKNNLLFYKEKETKMSRFLLNADWSFPTPIYYGVDRILELPALCKLNDIKRPLIVTDRNSKNLPFIRELLAHLKINDIRPELFSEISPNPLGSEILVGKSVFEARRHDSVIAIGGGSGMDGGKAISLIANTSEELWHFDTEKPIIENLKNFPKLICIPTTAGTGAETESTAMITHENLGMKFCLWHPRQKPVATILDPKLTIGLPQDLTTWTGLDALIHAIEAFSVKAFHPMADAMALQAMSLIGENLQKVVSSPDDIEAREAMLVGSCLAGISFLKGLGLVHAISHMIGAVYNSQHGRTNAILLPTILKYNEQEIMDKVCAMNLATFKDSNGYQSFYANICDLLDDLSIDRGIESLGVLQKSVPELALKASQDPAAGTNPRKASVKDLQEIISAAINSAR